ncbi:MAG: hypothetical protein ABEJ70_07060 [Halobacteriaceae archaeon]
MRRSRPLALVVALLGLLVGALAASGQFLPALLDVDVRTVGLYMAAANALSFLLSPVGTFLLGYWAGAGADVPADYGTVALLFGAVGGVAVFAGFLVVAGLGLPAGTTGGLSLVLMSGYAAAFRVAGFAIDGVAGAAVAHFRGR